MKELTPAAITFGGSNTYSGVSTSRTLMLRELTSLFATVPAASSIDDYKYAIITQNVLLKPSAVTRSKTYSYLRDRFGLNPDIPIFSSLRLLWERDPAGQPLMALLVAAFRDPVLRSTIPLVIQRSPYQPILSPEFAEQINLAFPGKLRDKTLKSTGENTTSTYKQSGHLSGKSHCIRQRVTPTPGSTTLAFLLASLNGSGGTALFDTEWVQILDSPNESLLAEARIAASRGWLEYRHAGDVLEITFRQLKSAVGALQ